MAARRMQVPSMPSGHDAGCQALASAIPPLPSPRCGTQGVRAPGTSPVLSACNARRPEGLAMVRRGGCAGRCEGWQSCRSRAAGWRLPSRRGRPL